MVTAPTPRLSITRHSQTSIKRHRKTLTAAAPALASASLQAQKRTYRGEQERMEPLLVPRLPDPVACLDETKAANREFTYLAGVLSIRDSLCIYWNPGLGAKQKKHG
jgi:hypothetical protein